MVALAALLGVALALAAGWAVLYNRLVTRRNAFRNAFAQIDVQLRRRYDLIPNLVDTARAYLKHERETLERVVAARAQAAGAEARAAARPGDPQAMTALASAEATLTGSLSRLLAVVEGYPELKANETVGRLLEELASTENRVAFARQAYNDAVMTYNNARETFPGLLVAGPFPPAEALAAPAPEERAPVRVAL